MGQGQVELRVQNLHLAGESTTFSQSHTQLSGSLTVSKWPWCPGDLMGPSVTALTDHSVLSLAMPRRHPQNLVQVSGSVAGSL